jgi:drug/metabolite transporter (DMT)-like permease
MSHTEQTKPEPVAREAVAWLAHGPTIGMLCVLIATFCFSGGNALVRAAAGHIPAVEVSFLRSVFALLLQVPIAFWMGLHSIRTQRLTLHATRGVLHAVSMILWFVALPLVPLSEAASLEFAAPIITTIIAIAILGEAIRVRRIVALAVGIAGVFIVVRPGFETVTPGQILCLVSVALWSGCQLIIRELGRTESAFVQGFYTVAVFTPITLLVALPTWVWPDVNSVLLCLSLAVTSTLGTWFYGEAFRRAEMTAILPLESTKLVWAVMYGFLIFGEVPEAMTIIGGVIIFAAAAYITLREAQLARLKRV